MGKRSARIFLCGKDHKDVFFDGHYHNKIYMADDHGNITLVWEKLKEPVEPPKEGIFKFLIMPIDTFTFMLRGSVHIDWGDGESSDFEDVGVFRMCRHSYAKSAKFMVQISGDIQDIRFWWGDANKPPNVLIEIFTKLPKTMEKVTSLMDLFRGNPNLERIPAELFDNCPNAEDFSGAFMGCSGLKSIPEGLFDSCHAATDFGNLFDGCTGITQIPQGLFRNCTNVESFRYTFKGCTGITQIPQGLFDGQDKASDFEGLFSKCKKLVSVPQGLFGDCTNASNFERAFESCESIVSVPENLFENCLLVENFGYTFYYCKNISSNVPELWKTHSGTKEHGYCYWRCTNAANYDSIPLDWIAFQ